MDAERAERVARYPVSLAKRHTAAKEVERKMSVSRGTAARWVLLAREKGKLGKTEKRKAGG